MSEDVLDVIRKRRTIRRFTEEPVSEEHIDTLLELAMAAPSRLNRTPWHFVVIRDKTLQKQLADCLRIHPYIERAPVVIAVCGIPSLSPTWAMDVSAAVENMLIGATALDLGAAWIGAPETVVWTMCEEFIRDAVGIPIDVRIPFLLALGHPAQEWPAPHGRHDRFDPLRVHYDRWESRSFGEHT
jgi:nitroreductase